MKKFISIFCCVGLILSSAMLVFPALAVENISIEEFAEDMSELYAEEIAEGKELEESVACRVIVKATSKPDAYKNAECISGSNNLYVYQYSDEETAREAVEYYNSLPYVKWAELDGIIESQALSYGNHMVQGDEAKDFVVNNNILMNEIVVAVLDTGATFDTEKFKGRVFDSGYNLSDSGIKDSANADHSHGNYVTNILVDNTPENVKIIVYKTMNNRGLGTNSSLALGIELAVDNGADIINISSISNEFSNAIYDAVKYAYNKGVIIVCSAGNEGDDVSKYYPASFDEVFAVGSIDINGNYSFFSNHGEEIDFVAPGHNIEVSESKKDYGTSFSAPFVSAAAAMTLSVNPELTIDETKNILIESSVPYGELYYYDGFHMMHGYDYSESGVLQEMYVEEIIDDESLYYGYGMPQIQNAVGIALSYKKAVKPEISVESGTYHEAFEVTISAPDGYEIYYTTNENYPSKDSAIKYSSPITVQNSQSIRAIAYSPNGMKSLQNTAEYRVLFYADEKNFTIDSEGYLTSYTGNFTEFIVPEIINGITVTGIKKSAINNQNIKSIVLPETLIHIASNGLKVKNAIYISAKGLKVVDNNGIYGPSVVEFEAPNIEKIGSMSLGVKSISFPKVTEIGEAAFAGSNFKEINLPLITTLPYGVFSDCWYLRKVHLPSVTSVDFAAFANCYWLKTIDMPNVEKFTAEFIDEDFSTFQKCYNLEEVSFPNLVEIEGERLFDDCYHLKKVELKKAQSICPQAFIDCSRLTDIKIPAAQIIGDYAFAETASLIELELPNAIELGDYAFKNSSLKTLNAPALETIGQYCFTFYNNMRDEHLKNTKFTNINAPKLKTASDYAFAYTEALTKLELQSLADLGKNAFFESSVSYFDAPKLKNTSSLPTVENSIAILSSEFSECLLDAKGYSLTIYGTPDTYAQTYAEQYGLTFIPAPAIINDLPAEYFEGLLIFNVAGFNKTYQWYGTNNATKTGTPISGAINADFDPTGQNFKYYYCVVSSNDNGHTGTVKTSLCQNMLYSVLIVPSNARITIATPSNRYLKYGESINLYANATGLPEGAKIKWRIVEGNGVTLDPSVSGAICTVTSKSNGFVTIEAYAVNKNGNTLVNDKGNRICDQEGISSEVSLWWIILYYIRQMFGITKTAVNFAIWS